MDKKHPVFVFGLYFPGLDAVRIFRKEKIQVIGIESNHGCPGIYTRLCKVFVSPDPQKEENKFFDFIISLAEDFNYKPVIINTADVFVNILNKNKSLLEKYFLYSFQDITMLEKLNNKYELTVLADDQGIPIPKTIKFQPGCMDIVKQFKYPVVIRPMNPVKWREKDIANITKGMKLIVANNFDELTDFVNLLMKYDNDLLFQEVVQGVDSNLYYAVCYGDKNGDVKGFICGQKLRLVPIHYGSASYMKLAESDEVLMNCKNLLSNLKYHGPAGIEFKKDDSDGKFKIIEVNTRFGLWDIIGKKIGINFYLIAYFDLTGQEYAVKEEYRTYYWLSLTRDIPNYFVYRKEGLITLWDWIKTYKRNTYISDFYWNDPKVMYHLYIKKLLNKIF